MKTLRLQLKFLVLLLLGMSAYGRVERQPASASCGKCSAIVWGGQVVGYGCYNVSGAKHGCYATSQGCYFVQNLCGS